MTRSSKPNASRGLRTARRREPCARVRLAHAGKTGRGSARTGSYAPEPTVTAVPRPDFGEAAVAVIVPKRILRDTFKRA